MSQSRNTAIKSPISLSDLVTGPGLAPAVSSERFSLAKLNQLIDICFRAAQRKGLFLVDIPILGTRDVSAEAIGRFRNSIMQDQRYWLTVFRQCEIVMNQ